MEDEEVGLIATTVECPYCAEEVEILLEADLEGAMVWDCEVCCRPWNLEIRRRGGHREVIVLSADE